MFNVHIAMFKVRKIYSRSGKSKGIFFIPMCVNPAKVSTAFGDFTDLLLNSPKRSPWFSPGYEGTRHYLKMS